MSSNVDDILERVRGYQTSSGERFIQLYYKTGRSHKGWVCTKRAAAENEAMLVSQGDTNAETLHTSQASYSLG